MKTEYGQAGMRIVGKGWEVREKLRALARESTGGEEGRTEGTRSEPRPSPFLAAWLGKLGQSRHVQPILRPLPPAAGPRAARTGGDGNLTRPPGAPGA